MVMPCCRYGNVDPLFHGQRLPRVLIAHLPLDSERSYFEIGNNLVLYVILVMWMKALIRLCVEFAHSI